MKKLGFILILSVALCSLFAQEYETVVETDLEQKMAERIEKLVYPILGFSIVEVDLILKYPASGLHPFGTDLDQQASLPGIPVAKSKGVMSKEVADSPTMPTMILSKKIVVHVDRAITKSIMNEQQKKLAEWFRIDLAKGDMLDIVNDITKPDLPHEEEEKDRTFILFFSFVAAFLLVQIILIFVFIKKTDISSHLVD